MLCCHSNIISERTVAISLLPLILDVNVSRRTVAISLLSLILDVNVSERTVAIDLDVNASERTVAISLLPLGCKYRHTDLSHTVTLPVWCWRWSWHHPRWT